MGSPSRFLLVAAPADARDAVTAAAVRWAAQALAARARVVHHDNENDPRLATIVWKAALALDPKNASAHRIAADVLWGWAGAHSPRLSLEPAIAEARAAVDPAATFPLPANEAWSERGALGYYLVVQGGHDPEALRILQDVVAHAPDPGPDGEMWNHKYNLACAYARLKKKDEALALITQVVEQHAKTPLYGVDQWREDEDFAPLHDDPRWKALLAKYPADADAGK